MGMTKEEKAVLLLEVYDQEKNRLQSEVLSKKAELLSKKSDPDNADFELKKINEYYDLEKGRIERRFLRAICSLEG